MAENPEIQAGDVVCLKSDKSSHTHKKFTVGVLQLVMEMKFISIGLFTENLKPLK